MTIRFSLAVTRKDGVENEHIGATARVRGLGDEVREARFKWFGHVKETEYIGRRMLEMEVPNRK